VQTLYNLKQIRASATLVPNDDGFKAWACRGCPIEPGGNVGGDAELPGLEDDSPHTAGSLALVLEELVQSVLRGVELERLKRPEFRSKLERLFCKKWNVGM
jgi:hypothetical protein